MRRPLSRGFTLIEILLTLAIIAVLAIGAFVIFPKVRASAMANTESNNINTIIASVHTIFNQGGADSLDALDTPTAIKANIFPNTMLHSGDASHAWSAYGTTVDIFGQSNGTFQISYTGVSSDICMKLMASQFSNVIDVYINGAEMYPNNFGYANGVEYSKGNNTPNPSYFATYCNSANPVPMIFEVSNS